jgi:hypothetical protein
LSHDLSFTPKYSIDGKLIDVKNLPDSLFNHYLLKNSKVGESELSESEIKKIEISKWSTPCKEKLFEVLIILSLFKQNKVNSLQNIIDLEGGHCDHISFEIKGVEHFILGNLKIDGMISQMPLIPDIVISKVSKAEIFGTEEIVKVIECKPSKKIDLKVLHEIFGMKVDLKIKDFTIITCTKVSTKIVNAANKLGINLIVFPLYDQNFIENLLNEKVELIDEKLNKALGI